MADEPAKEKVVEKTTAIDLSDEGTAKLIDMPAGGDLTPDSASLITAASLTRLVLIAGEAESGKTTLLATIYEKFNAGPFADFLFAGTATFVGWEKRCHFSRVASGSERADTERTLGLQQRLLHLRLRNVHLADAPQDILFTDLSGEVFKLVRDSTAECQQLGMLKRADHVVLLIDGKKIAEAATRHQALNNSIALLRSTVDAGMVGPQSFVDVVFSKYDVLQTADSKTSEFVNNATGTITTRFGTKLGRLRFHRIAARPESPDVEFGFGIPELLRSWVEDSPYFVNRLGFPVELPSKASGLEHYLLVRFPEFNEIRAWK